MQAFMWQREMRCWLRIADTRYVGFVLELVGALIIPFRTGAPARSFLHSEYFSLLDAVPQDPFISNGTANGTASGTAAAPLARLQAHCACAAATATAAATGGAGGPLSASALLMRGNAAAGRGGAWTLSRAHLEDRIASAIAIGSPSEFVHWLRLYSRHLAASPRATTTVDVARVRALCERLLAAPPETANGHAPSFGALAWWTPESKAVLGLSKRQLLRSVVLPAFASNRALQPIITEYMEALQLLEESDAL